MNGSPPEAAATGAGLVARFCEQADGRGGRVLIGDGTVNATGYEAAALVHDKMVSYARAGVRDTSRVGTVAWPPLDFVTDVFAVIGLNGVVVPLPRRVSAWELRRIDAMGNLTHLAAGMDSPLSLGRSRGDVGRRRLSACAEHVDVPNHGAASGQLTSGTTRHQRMALRPASALAVEAERYAAALRLTPDEPVLCPVPLHHAYGFGLCALAAMLAGVPVMAAPADRPRLLATQVKGLGGGLVPMVPPMLRMLAKAAPARLDGARLMTAGMRLDRGTAELVDTVLHARLGQIYGTTETGPICVTAPTDPHTVLGSLGRPLPGVTVRLSQDWPIDRGVPAEGTGLVAVTSPMAMTGYADDTGIDTGPVSAAGFLTGDLGRLTEDGLVLIGRVSSCINVAGAKVSPEEIEAVILGFPTVHACLVRGVVDDRVGERVEALVTPASVDLPALERYCAEHLSPPYLPSMFRAVPELEMTETGKVIRPLVGTPAGPRARDRGALPPDQQHTL